jgi:hypothetical protein
MFKDQKGGKRRTYYEIELAGSEKDTMKRKSKGKEAGFVVSRT